MHIIHFEILISKAFQQTNIHLLYKKMLKFEAGGYRLSSPCPHIFFCPCRSDTMKEFGRFGITLFTTDMLFLYKHKSQAEITQPKTSYYSYYSPFSIWEVCPAEPTGCLMFFLPFSSSSPPVCFINHGHILRRSQCFPKVSPAWWLDPGQL